MNQEHEDMKGTKQAKEQGMNTGREARTKTRSKEGRQAQAGRSAGRKQASKE